MVAVSVDILENSVKPDESMFGRRGLDWRTGAMKVKRKICSVSVIVTASHHGPKGLIIAWCLLRSLSSVIK